MSRSTTSCCVAELHTLMRPWAPIKTPSERSVPGRCLIRSRTPTCGPWRRRSGPSRTINSTGTVDRRSRIPPKRNMSLKPSSAAASPPTTGPIALPSATAEVTTPSAQPTRVRGVSAATSAVAAATVPLVAPWRRRRTSRSVGEPAEKSDDVVGRDRQPVDDCIWFALAQRVFDCVGDGGGDGDGPAFARAFETFGVRVGRRVAADQIQSDAHLAGADDRVVEKARGPKGAVGVVDGRLIERVADAVGEAAVQLSFERQRVDRLAGLVRTHALQTLDPSPFPLAPHHP